MRWAILVAVAACASESRPPPGAPAVAAVEPAAVAPAAPLGEAEARAVIAGELRRAGYRVEHDVVLEGAAIALDGWDDVRRAGFEYVADFAGDPPVESRAALEAAAPGGLLIIAAAPEAEIRRQVAAWLAAHPAGATP